ncbi:MAG TPA: ornithine--oxo-acid transaminase, partial [Euryarchaeota archaeon]|nr:ornithine--oxo-acid transaminase [Euryarchaeota archaeon]
MSLTQEFIEKESKYGAHNYHPLPVVLTRAEGPWVWDVDGKRYLDCLSAYSAVNQGHRHPRIVQALKKQLDRLDLTSRAFYNDVMGDFLKKLCEYAGFEAALPMNTGAEAVETGIKLARKWGYEKKGIAEGKAEIIVCQDNFHGRTTTIVGFSSDPDAYSGFGPPTPGFRMIPYDDTEALESAINENTAAFLVEPIQGEAGVRVPSDGYLKKVRDICTREGILLLFDEVQTGFGRTGKRFCFQHEDARPDVLLVGKALGGGLYPVSAALADWDKMEVF